MKEQSFFLAIRQFIVRWFPSLSRSETMELDQEYIELNLKRIFIYSIFGIIISLAVLIIIQAIFKERSIYMEKICYFINLELFHKAHIAVLFLFIIAYTMIKRNNPSRMVMKIFQGTIIILISLLYIYLSAISQYYHGDLVFYAVLCFAIALALYIRGAFRIFLYVAMFALLTWGMTIIIQDRDLLVVKTTNALILTSFGYVLSAVINGYRIREYHHLQTLTKTNLQLMHNLENARSMQKNLIPAAAPVIEGATICSFYRPMEMVGGDFYDFISFSKTAAGIFVGDISGHGVTASLITGMIKTLIDTADKMKSRPGSLLNYINSKSSGLMAGNFLTAAYGIVDTASMKFIYARGGHTCPLLIRNGRVVELESYGIFMGIQKRLIFEERTIHLFHGDRILLYTDGLIEATDRRGKPFKDVFMQEVLPRTVDLGSDDFVQYIYRELVRFTGEETFNDDVCMVGVQLAEHHARDKARRI